LKPDGHTYRSYALQSDEIEYQRPLPDSVISEARPYPCDEKPVFMGHYFAASVPTAVAISSAVMA
jgi:hypothetical protein